MPKTKCGYQAGLALFWGVDDMIEEIKNKDPELASVLKRCYKEGAVGTSQVYSTFLRQFTLLEIRNIQIKWEARKAHKWPSRHKYT